MSFSVTPKSYISQYETRHHPTRRHPVLRPRKKKFLKIQPGTGDNLLHEDRALGYRDYFLYSAFSPDDLGIDDELEMNCEDSGMILLKETCCDTDEIVADCVRMAFDEELGTIKLMTGDDL